MADIREHKENSSFVPVPNKGTFVPAADLADIIALLDEARGFAAVSPRGRENIASAIERLEDAAEITYRKGFVDGEQHSAEYDSLIWDKMLEEAIRRMNQPKILGFDPEKFPIDNPKYLPNGDTQIGVEFAIEFLSSQTSPKTYQIGDNTMAEVFTPAGLSNVSDLQAVFDAVESALSARKGAA